MKNERKRTRWSGGSRRHLLLLLGKTVTSLLHNFALALFFILRIINLNHRAKI
jgi:hypothetical protein